MQKGKNKPQNEDDMKVDLKQANSLNSPPGNTQCIEMSNTARQRPTTK